jgi:hypothetical protein
MKSSLWLIGVLVACAHTEPATPVPAPVVEKSGTPGGTPEQVMVADEPGLKIDVKPGDAELTISGQRYGRVADLRVPNGVLSLKPGIYQVSLKREGYQTWRAEVTVGEKSELLKVEMVKR